MKKSEFKKLIREEIMSLKDLKNAKPIKEYEEYNDDLGPGYFFASNDGWDKNKLEEGCSCGVKYVETKKSDIPYDTDDNVYYTDIMIYHCPKCGNIDRIEEY